MKPSMPSEYSIEKRALERFEAAKRSYAEKNVPVVCSCDAVANAPPMQHSLRCAIRSLYDEIEERERERAWGLYYDAIGLAESPGDSCPTGDVGDDDEY